MKPIKLTMSAFGPFPGLVEIDFARFERDGLFLLSGETGAGKTTIFDAISYALYGEVSGGERGTDHLRSDFAKPETETFVELEFEHRQLNYRINRIPRYMRPSLRGKGETEQLPKVRFVMPERELEKASDVKVAVEELLSVNYDQFKQIIMIAQGEFRALLTAESKERTEIMRRVFGTGIYAEVQERLKVLADKAGSEKEKIKNQQEKLSESFVTEIDTSDEHVALLKSEREKTKASLDGLLIKINDARSLDDTLKSLKDNRLKLAEAAGTEETIKAELDAANADEPVRESFKREISEIEAALPKYEAFSLKAWTLQEKSNRLKESRSELEGLGGKIGEQKVEQAELEEAISALLNAEAKAVDAKGELAEAKKRMERLKELEAAQKDFEAKNTAYAEAQEKYFETKMAYDDSLAGRLAQSLAEGEACPVCGSKEHPRKATAPDNAPSQAEYEKSEREYNSALASSSKSKGTMDSLSAELGVKPEEIAQSIHNQADINGELSDKKRLADADVQTLNNKRGRKKQLDDEYEANVTREKELTGAAHLLETELERLSVETENLKKELKHDSEDDAKGKLKSLKTELEKSQKHLEEKTQKHQKLREQIASLTALVENGEHDVRQLSEKLGTDGSHIDTSELEMQRLALATQQKELEEAERKTLSAKENNERIKAELEECSAKLEAAETLCRDAELLYKTASGNLSGRNKLQFETFVQQVYFDMVLDEANKRFRSMTDGRYELIRQSADKKQGKAGLDIDVFDAWSQKTRPGKTLSGGESFKAALALALGLSDVVQSHSGGVKIDAMFIDEGFGSLDSDSLDSAMNVITGLADGSRLVGIISHVDALKERIPQKIIVERDKVGSRIVEQN